MVLVLALAVTRPAFVACQDILGIIKDYAFRQFQLAALQHFQVFRYHFVRN